MAVLASLEALDECSITELPAQLNWLGSSLQYNTTQREDLCFCTETHPSIVAEPPEIYARITHLSPVTKLHTVLMCLCVFV